MQPMARSRFCRRMRGGVGVWLSARRMAVRDRRSDLGIRGTPPVAGARQVLNPGTSAAQPVSDPRTAFEIFRDQVGRWCARRADGLVFGTFVGRMSAIRFARRE